MSRINTNVNSLIAQTRLSSSNAQLQTALTRLSTGLRINSGKDDPAGLIASEALRSDITSVNAAITNSQRANQLIATADSALGQISTLLNDVRGLVTQSANGAVLSQDQIDANQLQVDSSLEAIDRISNVTTFQGRKLLDGTLGFTTNVTAGGSTIKGLNIQQANLGSAGSLAVNVDVTSAATQALISNNATGSDSINYVAGTKAAGSLTLQHVTTPAVQATGSITLTNTTGNLTLTAVAGGVADGTVGNATNVVLQNAADTTQATGTLTLTGGSIALTAAAGKAADGATGNNLTVVLQSGASTAVNNYDASTNTLTIDVAAGADTTTNIAAAITTDGTFTVGTVTGGSTTSVAGDLASHTAVTGSTAVNGTTSAAYNATTNVLTIKAAAGATIADLASAVNTGTTAAVFTANAGASGNSSKVYDHSDNGTKTTPISGGVAAIGPTSTISIQSNETGTAFNGTLTFAKSSSVTAGTVDVQLNGSNITVTLNSTDTSLKTSDIVTGIQKGLDAAKVDYTATLTSGTGTTAFDASADTGATVALTGGVDDSGTGLGADAVVKLSGANGSEVFNFTKGSSLGSIVKAINLVSDSTGVNASINSSGKLELKSSEYGSSQFVAADVISEGSGGTLASSLSSTRTTGQDIVATVNGVQARGNGNTLSVSNSALNLDLTVNNGSSTDISFNINGGGALFQLGPDVVTNQQARIGIDSVNTGELGGVAGRLYELKSGNGKSLQKDSNGAAKVLEEVITKVNQLRGRLGAFQKTTLDTNISSLTDTLSNLTAAQSSIRDADFAAESANLTRAQILVQSGTAVLQIANQNPQQVLSLLRG